VRSSGIVGNELAPEAGAADQGSEAGSLERDPNLILLANRAVAVGLAAWWRRYKNPTTGEPEGPSSLDIEIPSGRGVRHVYLDAEDAEVLTPFTFERWTVLGDYQAILDTDRRVILAEVDISGYTSLHKLPGATTRPLEKDESGLTSNTDNAQAFYTARPESQDNSSYLIVPALDGDLSLELYSHVPPEIAGLKGQRSRYGSGLTIRGVTAKSHNEALELLLDLSTSFFIDLDISYGLTVSLKKAFDTELMAQDTRDRDCTSATVPRFPRTRHNRDGASLYLYARKLIQMPLLEYLVYYQVIEFYLPTYTRSATIIRLRNILKDPGFDYSNDLALGRLLDTIAPTGRKIMNERQQVATTIASCVDDTTIAAFLDDRPAAAEALSDKTRIRGVRVISAQDRQTPLISQVAERIYDLRCRIVHSKDSSNESVPPIHPFERESRLMRHDLALIRFIAQRVLIASSRPASW
jgi:hypothetical protein